MNCPTADDRTLDRLHRLEREVAKQDDLLRLVYDMTLAPGKESGRRINQMVQAHLRRFECPDDCTIKHPIDEYAEINNLARSTVFRMKKRGLPCDKVTKRIPCDEARRWRRGLE